MGFGGISKAFKSVAKSPVGAIASPGTYLAEKAGGVGGLGNLLFGKKDKGVPDSYTPLDPLQQKALGKYNEFLDTDTDKLADASVNSQLSGLSRVASFGENQARQGAMDGQRQAQQLVAQRGLGRSSVGLNAILNQKRNLANQIGDVRANEVAQRNELQAKVPLMKYDMKLNNLNSASGGINNILNQRIFKQGREGGGRTGGLAGIIGAGIGAYASGGSPGGAQAGMGIGNALSQVV